MNVTKYSPRRGGTLSMAALMVLLGTACPSSPPSSDGGSCSSEECDDAGTCRSCPPDCGGTCSGSDDGATLTWEPPTTLTDGSELTSSLGFLVHYRADEGEEHTIDVTEDAVCGASECTVTVRDERFAGGDRYCFTVSAYDADDHSSARSNSACKEF